jgi:hypothetical protein
MAIFTLRQVVDAIRQNGLPQAYGTFFADRREWNPDIDYKLKDLKPDTIHACALGQAAFNLDVDPTDLINSIEELDDIIGEDGDIVFVSGIANDVINMNDTQQRTLSSIATFLENEYGALLDSTTINLRRVPTRYRRFKEAMKNG